MFCATTAYIWLVCSLCHTYISIYTYIQIKQLKCFCVGELVILCRVLNSQVIRKYNEFEKVGRGSSCTFVLLHLVWGICQLVARLLNSFEEMGEKKIP